MSTATDVNNLCLTCGCWTPEGEPGVHADHCGRRTVVISEAILVLERPDWDDYFFELARLVSTRATCPRASIGCVIVHPELHWVLATGYNGAPPGDDHCTEVGCEVLADHCVRARHAEANAADQILRTDRLEDGLVAYVIGARDVCSHCARSLYVSGVREVRHRES